MRYNYRDYNRKFETTFLLIFNIPQTFSAK